MPQVKVRFLVLFTFLRFVSFILFCSFVRAVVKCRTMQVEWIRICNLSRGEEEEEDLPHLAGHPKGNRVVSYSK